MVEDESPIEEVVAEYASPPPELPPISEWSHEQRVRICEQLVTEQWFGGTLPAPTGGPAMVLLPIVSGREIMPGASECVAVPCYGPAFRVQRLLIGEPMVMVDCGTFKPGDSLRTVTRPPWYAFWRGPTETVEQKTRWVSDLRPSQYIRDNWMVLGMFAGQNNMFWGSATELPGGLFHEANTIRFNTPLYPGLHLTVNVKNTGRYPARFMALAMGERITP